MGKVIGLILIATGGPRYTQFVAPLIESARKFFPPHEVVLFTDDRGTPAFSPETGNVFLLNFNVNHIVYQPDLGWPRATLMRYHAINKQEEYLRRRYGHVFYMDIDMLVTSPVNIKEICSDGITAVIHNGYPTAFERDPISTACLIGDDYTYYQGCLVGGRTEAFLQMTKTIARNIDIDDEHDHVAIWHDESHLNHYLAHNPPTISLSPAYAFPELHYLRHTERWLTVPLDQFVPKIRHLEKPDQGKWKNK